MIEIPIWMLITIPIAAITLGLGLGYKISEKAPNIISSDVLCSIAHFTQPMRPSLIIKNGKKVSMDCHLFHEKSKNYIKTNERCKFFSKIDYEEKHSTLINKLKNDKYL